MAVHALITARPAWFGLADTEQAVRVVFVTVAVWWMLLTVPLLIVVRSPTPPQRQSLRRSIGDGLQRFGETFRRIRELLLVAAVTGATGTTRADIAAVVPILVGGGLLLLWKVPEPRSFRRDWPRLRA